LILGLIFSIFVLGADALKKQLYRLRRNAYFVFPAKIMLSVVILQHAAARASR
jgi:hypothetical protein